MSEVNKNIPKCYNPDSILTRYISERLQINSRMDLIKEGKVSSLSEEEKKANHRLRTDKVRVLDLMFQAMTDLSYAIEQISSDEDLSRLFETDLGELFGIISPGEIRSGGVLRQDAFDRLLSSLIMPSGTHSSDFRLALVYFLIERIRVKVILEFQKEYPQPESPILVSVAEDFEKALGWVQFIAAKHSTERKIASRVTGYSKYPQPKFVEIERNFDDVLHSPYSDLSYRKFIKFT